MVVVLVETADGEQLLCALHLACESMSISSNSISDKEGSPRGLGVARHSLIDDGPLVATEEDGKERTF
jgi:hypothetical protein